MNFILKLQKKNQKKQKKQQHTNKKKFVNIVSIVSLKNVKNNFLYSLSVLSHFKNCSIKQRQKSEWSLKYFIDFEVNDFDFFLNTMNISN